MTIFFRSRFFFNNFFQKNISRLGFSKYILRQQNKIKNFLSAANEQ